MKKPDNAVLLRDLPEGTDLTGWCVSATHLQKWHRLENPKGAWGKLRWGKLRCHPPYSHIGLFFALPPTSPPPVEVRCKRCERRGK